MYCLEITKRGWRRIQTLILYKIGIKISRDLINVYINKDNKDNKDNNNNIIIIIIII